MEEENERSIDEQITVTIKARTMPELREKLLAILGETSKETEGMEWDFPEHIKKIYPQYRRRKHSAAMLTVLHDKHKGEENSVDSLTMANEMIDRFPRLFRGKTPGKVSFGNIFSGTVLKKRGLIKIGYEEYEDGDDTYRVYWVE